VLFSFSVFNHFHNLNYQSRDKNIKHDKTLLHFSLDYPPQKRKNPVKSLTTIGGALHS